MHVTTYYAVKDHVHSDRWFVSQCSSTDLTVVTQTKSRFMEHE